MRASIFPIFLLLAAAPAGAAYPDKPIRMIMPYPAGGSIDTAGRAVAQKLADTFGQQIVIDNRTGAGGVIGTETAARAVPDGYTLVIGGTGTLALSPHLHRKLPYDPVRDFAPVTMLIASPYVIVVHPSVAREFGQGTHRAREGETRPDQLRVGRGRQRTAFCVRDVQHGGRRETHACTL